MKIRGTLAVALAGATLVVAEIIQRTVVVGAVHLMPSRRHEIFASWQHIMARAMLGIVRHVGGARFDAIPRIPARPGVLVLMNHQSLMDIPFVVRTLEGGYPRIVTRARYARGKPLISHMVRLYQYPTVDPSAITREQLDEIRNAAAESPVPLVIFPEGTRTRDGSLGRFRRKGLHLMLGARRWEVWMVVVDGWWRSARLTDFVGNVHRVRGRITTLGPFESPDAGTDPEAFIREMEGLMAAELDRLRADGDGRGASDPGGTPSTAPAA